MVVIWQLSSLPFSFFSKDKVRTVKEGCRRISCKKSEGRIQTVQMERLTVENKQSVQNYWSRVVCFCTTMSDQYYEEISFIVRRDYWTWDVYQGANKAYPNHILEVDFESDHPRSVFKKYTFDQIFCRAYAWTKFWNKYPTHCRLLILG